MVRSRCQHHCLFSSDVDFLKPRSQSSLFVCVLVPSACHAIKECNINYSEIYTYLSMYYLSSNVPAKYLASFRLLIHFADQEQHRVKRRRRRKSGLRTCMTWHFQNVPSSFLRHSIRNYIFRRRRKFSQDRSNPYLERQLKEVPYSLRFNPVTSRRHVCHRFPRRLERFVLCQHRINLLLLHWATYGYRQSPAANHPRSILGSSFRYDEDCETRSEFLNQRK